MKNRKTAICLALIFIFVGYYSPFAQSPTEVTILEENSEKNEVARSRGWYAGSGVIYSAQYNGIGLDIYKTNLEEGEDFLSPTYVKSFKFNEIEGSAELSKKLERSFNSVSLSQQNIVRNDLVTKWLNNMKSDVLINDKDISCQSSMIGLDACYTRGSVPDSLYKVSCNNNDFRYAVNCMGDTNFYKAEIKDALFALKGEEKIGEATYFPIIRIGDSKTDFQRELHYKEGIDPDQVFGSKFSISDLEESHKFTFTFENDTIVSIILESFYYPEKQPQVMFDCKIIFNGLSEGMSDWFFEKLLDEDTYFNEMHGTKQNLVIPESKKFEVFHRFHSKMRNQTNSAQNLSLDYLIIMHIGKGRTDIDLIYSNEKNQLYSFHGLRVVEFQGKVYYTIANDDFHLEESVEKVFQQYGVEPYSYPINENYYRKGINILYVPRYE